MSEPAPAGYRPCVGIALFNAEGLVFFARRAGLEDAHAWQMPQGGIDAGETPEEAARRELTEETSVTRARLIGDVPGWLCYDLPPAMIRPSWRGLYRGQAQRWFGFRLDGPDSDIDLAPEGHEPEFDAWRWERLAATPALVVPFKRAVYTEVAKYFADRV